MKKITSHPIIKNGHNIVLALASILLIAVLFYAAFFVSDTNKVKAGVTHNVSGWAWGDNVGWISFNCTDTSSCDTVDYGVNVATNGDLSGYAWYGWEYCIEYDEPPNDDICIATEKIGNWISFNEAKLVGNNLEGWARACSVFKNGCSGELKIDDLTGGWEGWISLNKKPSDTYDYGVTKNGNNLEGYAWDAIQDPSIQCADGIDNDGDELIDFLGGDPDCDSATDKTEGVGVQIGIGWIDFSPTSPTYGGVVIGPLSTYVCTSIPSNTLPTCTGDYTGLSADTPSTVVISCDAPKCEYTCDSGYEKNGNSCVLISDGTPQCSDTIDNDIDTRTDDKDPGCYSAYPGCLYDPNDDSETDDAPPQCSNCIDDDGDGLFDYASDGTGDPGCSSATDNREQSIGFEEF